MLEVSVHKATRNGASKRLHLYSSSTNPTHQSSMAQRVPPLALSILRGGGCCGGGGTENGIAQPGNFAMAPSTPPGTASPRDAVSLLELSEDGACVAPAPSPQACTGTHPHLRGVLPNQQGGF